MHVLSRPVLRPWTLFDRPELNARDWFSDTDADVRYFVSGKAALEWSLDAIGCSPASNVLFPAYFPRRVTEELGRSGPEVRFYRVTEQLGADVSDVRRRVDDETVAVVSVNYFGFPQPDLDELRALTNELNVSLVDDNAHGAFSRRNGRLLGTFGDVGFTSLHKTLPVPDGAVMFGSKPVVTTESRNGHPDSVARYTLSDVEYCGSSLLRQGTAAFLRRFDVDSAVSRRTTDLAHGLYASASTVLNDDDHADPDPERNRGEMSRLTARYLESVDPRDVVASRRRVYRRWASSLSRFPGADPVYDRFPPGVCPWAFPVVADDAATVVARLSVLGNVYQWPDLPAAVAGNDEYRTANRLSRSLVWLPVHQDMAPVDVDRLLSAWPRKASPPASL